MRCISMSMDPKKQDVMMVVKGIDDAVVKLDLDARYVAMNRSARAMFRRLGRDPAQMLGQSVWEVFPDLRGTVAETNICEAIHSDASVDFELSYPADRHWYEVRGYASSPGVILIFRDITRHKSS
ncbi:MAG TPA: PAS domain-containing protein [Nitrospira sp.]|nr:PAS domain-containing protein [Nitrospira sp.]